MISQDEKTHGLLMWILSIPAPLISPLIFFLISTDKPFVKRHAAMSLTLCIFDVVIATVLFVTVVGILLLPIVSIFHLVVCIMGAMAANNGNTYDPPIVGGLGKSLFKV